MSPATTTTAHRLAPLERIPPGEGRAFLVGARRLAVFRLRSGALAATDAQCPHRGGPLADGLVGDGAVVCPLHNRRFALATGECDTDDGCAVGVYPATVDDDGWVVVEIPTEGSGRGA